MNVTILRRCRRLAIDTRALKRDAAHVLAAMQEPAAVLVVSLVGDREMQVLNRDYRGKDRPTDVLAFALREGESTPGGEDELGDVIISLDTAQRQATERGVTLQGEVRDLLIHGILHLLGFDHERGPDDSRRMKAKERWLKRVLERADDEGRD